MQVDYLGSDGRKVTVKPSTPLPITGSVVLQAVDIEIGAVEIKDATTDNRTIVQSGNIFANLRNAAGSETGITAMPLAISGNIAYFSPPTVVISGMTVSNSATSLGKAEDTAHSSADMGIFGLGVRNDTNTDFTNADGDYSPFGVDAAGNTKIVGNISHDSADAGNPLKIGGIATTNTTIPNAVANSDRVNSWHDLHGRKMVGGGFRTTYTANYRLTTRPYALSYNFSANTSRQYALIFHDSNSTKTVRIKEAKIFVKSATNGATYLFELRKLTPGFSPSGGNPSITPTKHNPASSAAEAICLVLPTTEGSYDNANIGWGTMEIAIGATAVSGIINPPSLQQPHILFSDIGISEIEPLIMRAGVAEGYAIVVDCNANDTLTLTAIITFTEE